ASSSYYRKFSTLCKFSAPQLRATSAALPLNDALETSRKIQCRPHEYNSGIQPNESVNRYWGQSKLYPISVDHNRPLFLFF
ncbi:hypothetical protein ACEOBH_17585, partial [Escherichia coli]|uniref:hypothetical protein n=1 Tax=Escherichia coli TaxID=562 RepID=UPI001F427314